MISTGRIPETKKGNKTLRNKGKFLGIGRYPGRSVGRSLTGRAGEPGVPPVRTLHDSRPEYRRPPRQVRQGLRVTGHSHRGGSGAEVKSGRRRRTQAAEPGQTGQDPRRGGGRGSAGDTSGGGSVQDVVYSVGGRGGAELRGAESRGQARGRLDPRGRHGHPARVGGGGGRGGGGAGPAGGQRVGRVQGGLHLGHAVQSCQRRWAQEEGALARPVHRTQRDHNPRWTGLRIRSWGDGTRTGSPSGPAGLTHESSGTSEPAAESSRSRIRIRCRNPEHRAEEVVGSWSAVVWSRCPAAPRSKLSEQSVSLP